MTKQKNARESDDTKGLIAGDDPVRPSRQPTTTRPRIGRRRSCERARHTTPSAQPNKMPCAMTILLELIDSWFLADGPGHHLQQGATHLQPNHWGLSLSLSVYRMSLKICCILGPCFHSRLPSHTSPPDEGHPTCCFFSFFFVFVSTPQSRPLPTPI